VTDLSRFHHGDRIVSSDGRHGVVEGLNDENVLVNWGLQQIHQGYFRSWESQLTLSLCPEPIYEDGVVVWKGTT
jgi:hypothetical protein